MVFKTSCPDHIKENLNSSTRHQLNEIKKEINALEGLGKITNKESNIAINEILSKIGYADIRASLNIENISLRIGQTKELAKIYQLNHELKKTDLDLSEMKGSREAFNSLEASDFIEKVKDEELSKKVDVGSLRTLSGKPRIILSHKAGGVNTSAVLAIL